MVRGSKGRRSRYPWSVDTQLNRLMRILEAALGLGTATNFVRTFILIIFSNFEVFIPAIRLQLAGDLCYVGKTEYFPCFIVFDLVSTV